jgi:hypothetical protein
MPSAGLKLAKPASERPQTHALDRAATGIGKDKQYSPVIHTKTYPDLISDTQVWKS